MKATRRSLSLRVVLALSCLIIISQSCGFRQRDEIIAGVSVPIPRGMSTAADQRAEVTLPGFGGGQAAYRGRVAPEEIIAFYQRELPARGWRPNASLVTKGGALAYSKENKSVLIMVAKHDGDTILTVIVGGPGL